MFDEWRAVLYYPLGVAPALFFSLRFLIQWIKSEKLGFSSVDTLFWRLSITGNLLSFFHFAIQGQYPFALIQAGNALIAWRNLNLMGIKRPYSLFKTLTLFLFFLSGALLCFAAIEWESQSVEWIRTPRSSTLNLTPPSIAWHFIGISGQALFASRFWIQWWQAEKEHRSTLGRSFWILSLSGSVLSALYFLHIQDTVSCLNQLFGIVPYMRNLTLSRSHFSP